MIQDLGRIVITIGVVITVIGAFLWLFGKLPFIGKLPGDILIQKPNFTFYAPIATGFIISVVLSLLLTLITFLKK